MGLVTDAVQRELEDLGVAGSGLGCSALRLASAMDDPDSTTSMAMCARELRETLVQVRALAASKRGPDRLDELAARREERLAV